MTVPFIELRGVDYAYPDGSQALKGLCARFERGKRTAILGRNGAGKSTLFALLNGLRVPCGGEVLFEGRPLPLDRKGLRTLRSRIGVVFQDPDTQLFSASIREDVSFGPMNLGLDKEEVRKRVEQALAAVGLSALAGRPVHALSHGEKKRGCIAGVLAMEPELLILDEPTAGLDPPMARELIALLDRLNGEGMTILMATHDVDLAWGWADGLCVVDAGEVIFQGTPDLFCESPEILESLGLELPWVVAVYRELRRRGRIDETGTVPRTKEDVLGLL